MLKTTIELPEELFVAAKRRAAEHRTTLRALIERGLRAELRRPKAVRATKLRWVTAKGGLPPHLDLRSRAAMHEWLNRSR